MSKRYAVLIGVDGLPVTAIARGFEEGLMPFLRWLVYKGYRISRLYSPLPFTLPAWTSISTGVWPNKHGVYDFLVPLPGSPPRLLTRWDVEYPFIGEMLAAHGVPSVSLWVPLSYPPLTRRSDCVVVSSWIRPRIEGWPSWVGEKISRILSRSGPPTRPLSVDEYLEQLCEGLERRLEAIEYCYHRLNWRLFYLVVPETDWAFHKAFNQIVYGSLSNPLRKLLWLVDRVFRLVYENAPGELLLLACSDHGFTIAHYALNGNVLLERLGVALRDTSKLDAKSKLALSLIELVPSTVKHRVKYLGSILLSRSGRRAIKGLDHVSTPVDYLKSPAFMTISYYIYVNRMLPSEERVRVKNLILRVLSRLKDFIEVIDGEKLNIPPYGWRAPDIILIPKPGFNVSTRLLSRRLIERGLWLIHSQWGFTLTPPGAVREPRMVDYAPTILGYLGLPLPVDADGEPIIPVHNRGRYDYAFKWRLVKKARGLLASKNPMS